MAMPMGSAPNVIVVRSASIIASVSSISKRDIRVSGAPAAITAEKVIVP